MTRPPLRLLLVLAAAALGFSLFRSTGESSSLSAVGPDAEAVLVVDGVDHEFELDTCFVGDHSFVVAGHGEYLPIVANDSPAGKARNRRVEIVVHKPR